jgi:hypothetical protein
MTKKLLVLGLAAILLAAFSAGPAMAADKMPAGPAKPVAAAGHYMAGTVNDAVWAVKTGVKKTGPFAVVTTPLLFAGQFCFRTVQSAVNVVTPWNAENYATDVNKVAPEMQKMADGLPQF